MKNKLIKTITELENSKWVKAVRNTEVLKTLIPKAEKWLNKQVDTGILVQRVKKIMSLLTSPRRGELLTHRNLLLLAAGILYVISPMDAIPDIFPILGYADDLAVITMLLNYILPSADKRLSKETASTTASADHQN